MIQILQSNFFHYHEENGKKVANKFDNTNGIVDQIKDSLKNTNTILFIASSPDDVERIEKYSSLIFEGLRLSGIEFKECLKLDNRTIDKVDEYISKADLIFLSGGDTYIQNEFFNKIDLKNKLVNYDGLVIGQSAGAINMACDAYNSPEHMEESEPIFFKGLGLTDINVEPHFVYDETDFTKEEVYQRKNMIDESYNRNIYGQCDGSHVIIDENGIATICGETYLISQGEVTKICSNGESVKLKRLSR